MIHCYFELCSKIWGGNPATEQITGGIETTDINAGQQEEGHGEDIGHEEEAETEDEEEEEGDAVVNQQSLTDSSRKRRAQLDSTLSQYKQQKMKKKVPADAQMLTFAKEEYELRRKMVKSMEKMEEEHSSTMKELSTSLKTLSDSVASAFSALNQVLLRPPAIQQPFAPPHVNYPQHYNTQVHPPFTPSPSSYFHPIPHPHTPTSVASSRTPTPSSLSHSTPDINNLRILTPINFDDDDC